MDIEASLEYVIFDVLMPYYEQTKDENLVLLISTLNTDPAAFEDWLKALKTVTLKETGITEPEAYQTMLALMREYKDNFRDDLGDLIEHFNSTAQYCPRNTKFD
jgi:hypothetical protein